MAGRLHVRIVLPAMTELAAFECLHAVALDAPVHALRLYRDRAYAVGRSWCGERRDVADLGTSLGVAGQHEVSAWVTRQDAGTTRARLRNNHVDLAQVAP